MNTRILASILTMLSVYGSAMSQVYQPRAGVQFYFSDVGGTHDRLHTDLVSGTDWTGQYDIIVKNTRAATIRFNGGSLMIGYAQSLFSGTAAPQLPGTDLVTLYDIASAETPLNVNPNVTAIPNWCDGSGRARLVGGSFLQNGIVRPYGLNVPIVPIDSQLIEIGSGETLFLARIALRDNGLFVAQGFHDIVLYDNYEAPGVFANTALLDASGDPFLVYHDGPQWEGNSVLRLTAVPEPTSLAVLALPLLMLVRRRQRAL